MDQLSTQFDDLWAIVVEVWQTSFLGYSVGDGLAATGVIVLAIVFRGLLAHLVLRRVIKAAESTETGLDDALVKALYGPVKLLPVILGVYVATLILDLQADGAQFSGRQLVQSLIVVGLFWALHNAVEPVARLSAPLRQALNPVMIDWLAKALRILFIIIGAATIMHIWGIPVAPVIGGLGLLGVAVGLGAQDLFRNLIAGILILTEKRFVPGEWVKVDGIVEGTVEQINFRSTLVRRFDKGPVFVPNSKLADNAVTNFSRMTHRRIRWMIGVEYSATTEQLKYIRDHVLEYVLNHPEYAKPPEVSTFMRVDSFNTSSIDFFLYCFTRTTNWGEWLRIKEELAFEIKRIVKEAGTDFAYPTTTVHIADGVERFIPPEVSQHADNPATDARQDRSIARGESGEGE